MSSSSEIDKTETVDNEAEKDVSAPPRKKLLTEAMRDIFVSTLLVILTILITQADFQKSPTSSLLASGNYLELDFYNFLSQVVSFHCWRLFLASTIETKKSFNLLSGILLVDFD